MDRRTPIDPIAPAAKILRAPDAMRHHLPRVIRTERNLLAAARVVRPQAALARCALELGPFRRALLASPYYARALRCAALSPRDLASLRDLPLFPTLDRATLAARWRDIATVRPDDTEAGEIVLVRSSGSTGEPVTVVRDGFDCVHMWGVLRFWIAHLGIRIPKNPRVALLCSLPGGLEYSAPLPLLHDGTLERISIVRPRPGARLRRFAPSVLFSDPAGLHWLVSRRGMPGPRIVLTSAQYFSAAQRRTLARRMPCPVVNYYATTETGPIAWECLRVSGRFHVLAPEIWAESVLGEIVVTRLRPSAFPILRYRTGDRGHVEQGRCECGMAGCWIEGFEGRRACDLVAPGGRRVDAWQLAWLFKPFALRDFRLTQMAEQAFDLEVVRERGGAGQDDAALRARLARALRLLGWREPELRLRVVRELDRDASKPGPFRCLVGESCEGP
jgi:phenylacetate-CoA ligase